LIESVFSTELQYCQAQDIFWAHSGSAIAVIDLNLNNLIDANPAVETLTGYRLDELLGLRFADLMAERESRRTNELLRHAPENQEESLGMMQIVRKDGREVSVSAFFSARLEWERRGARFLVMRDLEAKDRAGRKFKIGIGVARQRSVMANDSHSRSKCPAERD